MPPKRKTGSSSPKKAKSSKSIDSFESKDSLNLLSSDWYNKSRSKIFIGAHVSITGGLYKAVLESAAIGGQAFGLFLCNQRTWNVKPLSKADAEEFVRICDQYEFPSHLILPHASYLMNCGSPEEDKRQKSIDLLLDGVQRCELLNIDLYNFHPGSTLGKITREKCCEKIADAINYVHDRTSKVKIVLENMCKQGHTIGGDFKELRAIIDRVRHKSRVGVCLDTCHAFAAGYDISSKNGYEKMMKDFDEIIGFEYLKAIHLNDAKSTCGSHLDRHENIGKGSIGINGFKRIVNEPTFKDIPMILETPFKSDDTYRQEIEELYR